MAATRKARPPINFVVTAGLSGNAPSLLKFDLLGKDNFGAGTFVLPTCNTGNNVESYAYFPEWEPFSVENTDETSPARSLAA